jgi:dimethylaniline monooxygenase (N-oxide forming)
MHNKVAIIGAGPAGLVAAKECLANGLVPIVFESQPEIGGLWNPKTGGTWSGLKTNISTLTSVFPDFPWPEQANEFPTQLEMFQYLNDYADQYQIKQYIRFNCAVESLAQNCIQWQINSTIFGTECYDYVIIASGIFSKPYMPVESSTNVIHSSEYKSPQQAAGKNVIVYGGGFSGVDIAAAIAEHAQSVIHIVRSPHWIIPRYIGEQLQPLDKVFYNQANRVIPEECILKTEEENIKVNSYMATLAKTQTQDPSSPLYINPTSRYPAKVAISDTYLNLVASGKISVKAHPYESNNCDLKIYCTGYQLNLNYMHPDILKVLQFDSKDQLQPILLHKCTWHPSLPNMAFVGVYRGPYLPIMEQQAKWAALVFSNKLSLPDKASMHNSLLQEKATRDLPKALRPQFPHGDYIGLRNDLTKIVSAPRHGILHGYNLHNQRLALLKAVASVATYGLKEQVSKYVNKLRNF